jgi:hypothetical protein
VPILSNFLFINRIIIICFFFRGKRLAEGTGGSVQVAQMTAAKNAIRECAHLFPTFNRLKNNGETPRTIGEPPAKRFKLTSGGRSRRNRKPDSMKK